MLWSESETLVIRTVFRDIKFSFQMNVVFFQSRSNIDIKTFKLKVQLNRYQNLDGKMVQIYRAPKSRVIYVPNPHFSGEPKN